ncbi:MAG: hypothetical protein HYZ73_06555, partial [Elusimicrobia bacterium]|nr:hypothetical protein [Elusimicrobiota bacterium]
MSARRSSVRRAVFHTTCLLLGLVLASVAEAAWVTGSRWTVLLRGRSSPVAGTSLQKGPVIIEDLLRGFLLFPQGYAKESTLLARCGEVFRARTRPPQIRQWGVSRGRRWTETLTIGVPLATSIEVAFSEPMLSPSVRGATAVWALRNHRG